MSEWLIVLIAGSVVFITFTVEGIAGFGSTVMALPFIAVLIGVDKAVPVLSSLSILLSLFIVLRSRRNLDWREYGFIVLHVGLGVPVGLFMMDTLPKEWLIALLVCFMFFVGIRGLLSLRSSQSPVLSEVPGKKSFLSRIVLFTGGIIQGAFSSGGPVVVMYASKALKEKSEFRAVLSSLWLTTNTVMAVKWTLSGTVWTPQMGRMILGMLPFIAAGMTLGDCLHNKVDQRKFTVLVYTVLILAGVMLGGNLFYKLMF
ncbi:MAG: sulfite exporter TauE/SafE family protein [Lentisphaerae bacterium]|nr:sulfite exporter TauE/SafE family protein [Lentisphaerota bacterium]